MFQRLHAVGEYTGNGIGLSIGEAHHSASSWSIVGRVGNRERVNVLLFSTSLKIARSSTGPKAWDESRISVQPHQLSKNQNELILSVARFLL